MFELAYQIGFDEVIFRIGHSEIGKDISAAASDPAIMCVWHPVSPSI
jgi:hypothetical protein